MTPVYHNGNDYYKKMLELQRRLQRSEEERTRLEERFSLLEHESRSRHETCINRLRMRYIEFLEEQQVRDERNHKLLGTLERVDSSLALISAKTDRLGTLRRQYEATSLLKNWYANGRANGSVTGDSGVASQNNEGHGEARQLREGRASTSRREAFLPAAYSPGIPNVVLGKGGIAAIARSNCSPSKDLSDSCFNGSRTGITRYESSYAPTLSSAFRKDDVDERQRPRYVINGRPVTATRSQSSRRYRFDYPRSGGYESSGAQSPLRSPSDTSLGCSRNLFKAESATRRAAALLNNVALNSIAPIQNYSGFFEDGILPSAVRSPPGFPKVVDVLGKERTRDDDNEVYRVGDVVENELERYMRRIPKLYRESPQSPEEFDQEQNTSGDLLNVTLSDDDVEFSAEDAGNAGKSPAETRDRPARRPNTSGAKSAKVSPKVQGESENARGARDSGTVNDTKLRQLPQITSLSNARNMCENGPLDTENVAEILAKNVISSDVARDGTELGARPSGNDGNDAKSCESDNRDVDTDAKQTGDRPLAGNDQNEATVELRSGDLGEFNDPRYRVVSGAERNTGNYFCESTQDLEPWNLSALERRIQESLVLNDLAPQADFSQRESTRDPGGEGWPDRERESNVSKSPDASASTKPENQQKIDCYAVVGNEAGHPNDEIPWKNDVAPSNGESVANFNEVKPRDEVSGRRPQEYNDGADPSSVIADESIDRSTREYPTEEVREPTGGEANPDDENMEYGSPGSEMYANPENALYAQEEYPQDPNLRYEYPLDDRHQEGEHYEAQQYLAENDSRYDGGGSGEQQQYGYELGDQQQYRYDIDGQQQYQAYNDLNDQYIVDGGQGYAFDPNQAYLGEESRQYQEGDVYTEDGNQVYPDASAADGNYPEAQEYARPEIHEQSGLPDNQEFAIESSDAHRYDGERHEAPMEQIHGASAVRELEAQVESELTTGDKLNEPINADETNVVEEAAIPMKKSRDVIRSLLDSDTESTIEKNVSNAESDFDFN